MTEQLTTPELPTILPPPQVTAENAPPVWLARFESDRRTACETLLRGGLAHLAKHCVAFFNGEAVEADERFDLAQKRAAAKYGVPVESIFVLWVEPPELPIVAVWRRHLSEAKQTPSAANFVSNAPPESSSDWRKWSSIATLPSFFSRPALSPGSAASGLPS